MARFSKCSAYALVAQVGQSAGLVIRGSRVRVPSPAHCSMKVLFIAGFGPVASDVEESRRLYEDALGLAFKIEDQLK